MLSEKDSVQIATRGSDLLQVEKQIANFKSNFPFLDIQKPASIGDGILKLNQDQIADYISTYTKQIGNKKVLKFVPASGAATRMFKDLFAFLDNPELSQSPAAQTFANGLKDFAFFERLSSSISTKNGDINDMISSDDIASIIDHLLSENGLSYGSLPKALLSFHQYENGSRTPLEEHLVEGANYAKGDDGIVHLHFTVSPEHQAKFSELVNSIRAEYEKKYDVNYEISFSQQKKSTDTIAVNTDNTPFREDDESILFRPAGHGALLENLNDLDADVIFVKNIDNVAPDRLKEDTFKYKKALASILVECQNEIFALLRNDTVDPDSVAMMLKEKYFIEMPKEFADFSKQEKVAALKVKLNRPVRVCGMVPNTGEPGGGPFWVAGNDGSASLQIAETAQIDLENPSKAEMLKNSTHFNPVDLVCGVKDFEGNKFDLLKYRDDETGFISMKSKNGKDLKAMELPGLWNGAMADWITFFVEVPITTFSPVKTVNDLLKDVHQ
ncbi:MAG: DUF4301 family protein [Reichenbachiella sp.]